MKLKELEKRLKQEPGNLGLRVQVAGRLRETGRSIEAVEHYRTVALAYRDQGRTQQAIAVCRSILEIAPEDAACHGLLAMLQGRTSTPIASRIGDELPERPPQKSPSVPPIGSRAATSSTGPVKVPSVPSLRPPTPRPTDPPPVQAPPLESRSRPVVAPVKPVARPTPDERPLARTTDPIRRSSIDETPLPKPMPYHLADRTSQPSKISSGDLELPLVEGADTRPGHEERRSDTTTTTGLAQAARKISGLLDSRGAPHPEMDLSAELDTRERARIAPEQLEKIDLLPATPPLDAPPASFIDRLELDELTTPPPADDLQTQQVRSLTPLPRGSEDALTPPPLASPRRAAPSMPPPNPRAQPVSPHVRSASLTSPQRPIAPPSVRSAPSTVPPSVRSAPSTVPPSARPGSSTMPPGARPGSSTMPPSARPAPTAPPVSANVRPAPATRPPVSAHVRPAASAGSPGVRPGPSVPAPAKRPTPSVPSLANRATPAVVEPIKRPTPSVPPLARSAPPIPVGQSPPHARRPTPSLPRPTPTSLPPPPSSSGTPSRPSLVAIIPPKGASSRSSITIETRGPSSSPPSDGDEELTQPRDRLGLDDDD